MLHVVTEGSLPHGGVNDSKWQLTSEHLPKLGFEVWGQAEVVFLYLVESAELLIRLDTLIMPSRWDEVKLSLPGWHLAHSAGAEGDPMCVLWLPWKAPVEALRYAPSRGR